MTVKQIPAYLKIHADVAADASARRALAVEQLPYLGLPALCTAFEQATGWRLQYAEPAARKGALRPRLNVVPREDQIASRDPLAAPIAQPQAAALAEQIDALLGELLKLQRLAREHEAERAVSATPPARPDDTAHLADRLEDVLRGGAQAVGADAAALYLLDENTSELKLRSVWQLPYRKLIDPPRPLSGSIADLEALTGHAVVLEDTSLYPSWNVPEAVGAAVCVPVATPHLPLGTMWVYSQTPRDFLERQVHLIEIVAGRAALELERETLARQHVRLTHERQAFPQALTVRKQQLPQIAPIVEGYELQAWHAGHHDLGGVLYDWYLTNENELLLAIGQCIGGEWAAALTASSLLGAWRSAVRREHRPQELLRELSDILWSGSAGDRSASLWIGKLDLATGKLEFSTAGKPTVMIARPHGVDPTGCNAPYLGEGEAMRFERWRQTLATGDTLLIATEAMQTAATNRGQSMGEAPLAELLHRRRAGAIAGIAEHAERLSRKHPLGSSPADRAMLVLRRAGKK